VVVADSGNNCLRAVSLEATPKATVLIGGSFKAGLKDGDKSAAELNKPISVAADATAIYFGEGSNGRIRRFSLGATNDVKTISGKEAAGNGDGAKDVAQYTSVVGLAVTSDGTTKKRTLYAYDIGPTPPQGATGDQPGPNIRIIKEQ
jgi:hypothetical protein